MSSVGRYFAQPKTRTFAVTQGDWGAYFYSQEDVDTWYAANASKINKLSETFYIIPGTESGSTFVDVLTGNGATELQHTLPRIDERKTVIDMGKEIIIGNTVTSRLFVLRLVQEYSPSTSGSGTVGFVVTENNAEDLQGNNGRFTLRVART